MASLVDTSGRGNLWQDAFKQTLARQLAGGIGQVLTRSLTGDVPQSMIHADTQIARTNAQMNIGLEGASTNLANTIGQLDILPKQILMDAGLEHFVDDGAGNEIINPELSYVKTINEVIKSLDLLIPDPNDPNPKNFEFRSSRHVDQFGQPIRETGYNKPLHDQAERMKETVLNRLPMLHKSHEVASSVESLQRDLGKIDDAFRSNTYGAEGVPNIDDMLKQLSNSIIDDRAVNLFGRQEMKDMQRDLTETSKVYKRALQLDTEKKIPGIQLANRLTSSEAKIDWEGIEPSAQDWLLKFFKDEEVIPLALGITDVTYEQGAKAADKLMASGQYDKALTIMNQIWPISPSDGGKGELWNSYNQKEVTKIQKAFNAQTRAQAAAFGQIQEHLATTNKRMKDDFSETINAVAMKENEETKIAASQLSKLVGSGIGRNFAGGKEYGEWLFNLKTDYDKTVRTVDIGYINMMSDYYSRWPKTREVYTGTAAREAEVFAENHYNKVTESGRDLVRTLIWAGFEGGQPGYLEGDDAKQYIPIERPGKATPEYVRAADVEGLSGEDIRNILLGADQVPSMTLLHLFAFDKDKPARARARSERFQKYNYNTTDKGNRNSAYEGVLKGEEGRILADTYEHWLSRNAEDQEFQKKATQIKEGYDQIQKNKILMRNYSAGESNALGKQIDNFIALSSGSKSDPQGNAIGEGAEGLKTALTAESSRSVIPIHIREQNQASKIATAKAEMLEKKALYESQKKDKGVNLPPPTPEQSIKEIVDLAILKKQEVDTVDARTPTGVYESRVEGATDKLRDAVRELTPYNKDKDITTNRIKTMVDDIISGESIYSGEGYEELVSLANDIKTQEGLVETSRGRSSEKSIKQGELNDILSQISSHPEGKEYVRNVHKTEGFLTEALGIEPDISAESIEVAPANVKEQLAAINKLKKEPPKKFVSAGIADAPVFSPYEEDVTRTDVPTGEWRDQFVPPPYEFDPAYTKTNKPFDGGNIFEHEWELSDLEVQGVSGMVKPPPATKESIRGMGLTDVKGKEINMKNSAIFNEQINGMVVRVKELNKKIQSNQTSKNRNIWLEEAATLLDSLKKLGVSVEALGEKGSGYRARSNEPFKRTISELMGTIDWLDENRHWIGY